MNKVPEDILNLIKSDSEESLASHLGIEFTHVETDKVIAKMPVDKRTVQRFGILHGGASVALAENVASVAAWLNVDRTKNGVVGLEINANHLRKVRSGFVHATATPIKIGKKIHVWDIKIHNDDAELVCISRCTMAVIDVYHDKS